MPERQPRFPIDLRIFGAICAVWATALVFRVITQTGIALPGDSFQTVFLGIKFYGLKARTVMLLQAAIYAAIAVGIFQMRRWGLIIALLYMVQVVVAHLVFILSYAKLPGQEVHVKIAAIEGPFMVLILLFLWIRSRDLIFGRSS
jgi:hypothetical protein